MRGFLCCLLLSLCLHAHAVEIAFYIKINTDGNIEVYEEGTLFSHVAIRVGEQWLEARPWNGVHLTQDTSNMGVIARRYVDPTIPEPDSDFLESVLGRDYFLFADWHDPNVFNCTKLVAKYLNIEPNPMSFDPLLWGNRFHEHLGKPGLSLLELEVELQERSFSTYKSNGCHSKLLKVGN